MAQKLNTTTPSLTDAFYALSLERRIPNAELLDDVVRRYPQYATELTEFAIELVLDGLHDTVMESVEVNWDTGDLAISPVVSRAMSRFQNRFHHERRSSEAATKNESLVSPTNEVFNPFNRLNREGFRTIVDKLDASTVFVAKLRDRQIDPTDITEGFRQEVAEILGVSINVVATHFDASPTGVSAAQQFYKAAVKPSASKRQSFKEAVESSHLSEGQQQRLMRL